MRYYYEELGLKQPDALEPGVVTLEGLAKLNPDHIFLFDFENDPVAPRLEKLSGDEVWNSLDAVKNKQVHIVDSALVYPNPISLAFGIDAVTEAIAQ